MKINKLIINSDHPYAKRIKKIICSGQIWESKTVASYQTGREKNALKIVRVPGIPRQLVLKVYGSLTDSSKLRKVDLLFSSLFKDYARIAYKGSLMLHREGIPTPAPLACWTQGDRFWLKVGCFLYEQYPSEHTLEQIRHKISSSPSKADRLYFDMLVSKMAKLTKKMHDAHIRHGDIVTHNFLVDQQDNLVLIDTDHVKKSNLYGPLRCFLNFHCLRRLDFTPQGHYFFLMQYFGRKPTKLEWLIFRFWFLGGFKIRRWLKGPRPPKLNLIQPGTMIHDS